MREHYGSTMEETLGTRFGNYELVRPIDVGGMGEVYLARQLTAFSRTVAIKIIRSDLVHDATARARFLREAEVSAHLKHEHILALFDFGEVDGRLYLATPYIEGGNLATRLKTSGPLSLVEAHQLFVPLVQAVAYIHRRGVVHRDLKPTNIMLDMEDGEIYVRLIDFGIATLQGRSASPPLTTAGNEMGTVAYMAPERLSGIAAPSNDIFSLGVILHQMLTGRMPTATSSATPRLAEPLARVVRRATATNPDERYATAEELLKDFERAYQQIINPVPAHIPIAAAQEHSAAATNRLIAEPPAAANRPELVSLAHSGELPAFVAQASAQERASTGPSFMPDDYDAPTTFLQQSRPMKAMPNSRPPLIRPRPPRSAHSPGRNSLVVIISLVMVLVLIVFVGLLYYGYQVVNTASVSINFSPRAQVVSQTVTIKADPNAAGVNIAQATIPEGILKTLKSSTSTGATTGQVNCVFVGIGCQQGVSQSDVDTLVAQMQPALEQSITQDLQSQVNSKHGTQIGAIFFSNLTTTSNPAVGQPGKTVTVNLSEQGSVGYFLDSDATTVARQALVNAVTRLGQNYQIVDSTVTIGKFTVRSIDQTSAVSTIVAPEGVVALYQFTQSDLQAIRQGLVGKSQAEATAFLQSQPGIDPNSIVIHFTAGNSKSMPGDAQNITLIPLAPANLPSVSLSPVANATLTPTDSTSTPTSANTPTG